MYNSTSRILFLSIFTITMFVIFSLIIWRGSIAFGIPLKTKTILLLPIGMMLVMIGGLAMSSFLPGKFTEIFGIVLLRIIYAIWIIGLLLICRDIISILYKITPVVMVFLSILLLGFGVYFGTNTKTTPLNISSNLVKKDYKIVFISDFHVEAIHHKKYIQSIVNKIESIKPDFVLLGGDLMNTAKTSYIDAFLPFNQLNIPIYATLGNHDNMGNKDAISGIFDKTKIIPLRNKSIEIDGLQIVGIDDKTYRGKMTLPEILKESKILDNKEFTILISHQPQDLKKLEEYPIDLELAGHTHNGQFRPMSLLIKLFNDYSYGKYQNNGKTAFVSQGIGSRGAPIRIGTQSELVLISLKPELK